MYVNVRPSGFSPNSSRSHPVAIAIRFLSIRSSSFPCLFGPSRSAPHDRLASCSVHFSLVSASCLSVRVCLYTNYLLSLFPSARLGSSCLCRRAFLGRSRVRVRHEGGEMGGSHPRRQGYGIRGPAAGHRGAETSENHKSYHTGSLSDAP